MKLSLEAPFVVPEETIRRYREDGATVLRGVVAEYWIERMHAAIQDILDNPGEAAMEYTGEGKTGRYYGDFFLWRRNETFRNFMATSGLPAIAAQFMTADEVAFFYDQLLVKEPNTKEETPWHQDLPYWPVRGEQIISIWVPFDVASVESGVVQYIKGSHKWGKMFAPKAFGDTSFADVYKKGGFEPLPDIDANIADYEILHWEMEPGDILLHHPLTLHYARGNASATGRRRGLALRYVGEDAQYDTRPGTFMENPRLKKLLPEITLKDGDRLLSDLFPKVWPHV